MPAPREPRPLPMETPPRAPDWALVQVSQLEEAAGTGTSVGEFREPDELMPGAMMTMAGRATEEERERVAQQEPEEILGTEPYLGGVEPATYEKNWLHGWTERRLRLGFAGMYAAVGALLGWIAGGRAFELARNLRM